jgi:hypothetical protein
LELANAQHSLVDGFQLPLLLLLLVDQQMLPLPSRVAVWLAFEKTPQPLR